MIELHNGDCIKQMNSMDDKSVDLIVTDPPYLMNYQSNKRTATEQFAKIAGDVDGHQLIQDYFKECHRILKDNTHIYSFCSWHHVDFFKQEFEKHFELKNIIIWYKSGGGIGDLEGSYITDYEFALFGHKGRRVLNRGAIGGRGSAVFKINKVNPMKMVHATEKPVSLIEKMVIASSDRGDVVFDGFMGAGSHGMAAVRNERSFIGCELDINYYNIAKERIESASSTLDQFFV
jgi:site-specific DNA-methyltransferase (adenine-specific)